MAVAQSNKCSAIMKAKYYPNTRFLNAEVGLNPSNVWRSIMAALMGVRAGVRRKIGNGLDTDVWRVPWLPSLDDGFLNTSMPDHLSEISVSNLMVTGKQRWDIDPLNDICVVRDVELIKLIPLSMSDKMDSWFWALEDKGDLLLRVVIGGSKENVLMLIKSFGNVYGRCNSREK